MFASKAGAYPSQASFLMLHHSRVGFWPYPQMLDQAEMPACDKRTNLFGLYICDKQNQSYNIN